MEKYGGTGGANSDRAFWLQSFNGGCYTVDRIKRGETFIENLSVSIIGSIQPEKLGEIHGLTSDGLMQRFLPITVRSGMFATDTPVNAEAYQLLIRQLTNMKPAEQPNSENQKPFFAPQPPIPKKSSLIFFAPAPYSVSKNLL
jgi:Protein of unknown function (DUF3987)